MSLPRVAIVSAVALAALLPVAGQAVAGHSAKHVVAALDPDKDGSLDRREIYRGAIAKFKRLNTDNDRTLEPDETRGVLDADAFKAANPDNDGTLSLGEYLRLTKKLFKAANTDGDRTIEADELQTPVGRVLRRVIY